MPYLIINKQGEFMTFGKNLKRLRQERELTQQMLAKKLFISRQSISKWENDISFPPVMVIKKLIVILKCSYEDLFDYDEKNK